MGALLWVKSLFYDLEADLFLTVLSFLVKSIFWTSRHELLFPLFRVLSLSEVGVLDSEANLFFVSLVVGALLK